MYRSHHANFQNSKNYLGIGDPYVKKSEIPSRIKGKQFLTIPPKVGQTAGYFHPHKFNEGDGYVDRVSYLTTQPRDKRKKGFGSMDAFKSDEFAMGFRARQWKEALKGEEKMFPGQIQAAEAAPVHKYMEGMTEQQKQTWDKMSAELATEDSEEHWQNKVPKYLYDIGKEGAGTTKISQKDKKDTFYSTHRCQEEGRNLYRRGPIRTSSSAIGNFNFNPEEILATRAHSRPGSRGSAPDKISGSVSYPVRERKSTYGILPYNERMYGRRRTTRSFNDDAPLQTGSYASRAY